MDARGKFILVAMIVGAWLWSNMQDVYAAYDKGEWMQVFKQIFNLAVGAVLAAMALFNARIT